MGTVLKDVEVIVGVVKLSKSHGQEDNLIPFFVKLSLYNY